MPLNTRICGSKSLRCFAINDNLACDCHNAGAKLEHLGGAEAVRGEGLSVLA